MRAGNMGNSMPSFQFCCGSKTASKVKSLKKKKKKNVMIYLNASPSLKSV